ncbi:GNAT family N-acetyltransferase (plasmid) [Ureibacillus chungkukjangi]|uniref:GNAT family N-acetyltransferase n=1 Tax=Ureibacillus chungkukjangi TaxID=1202712 RepID=UPI00187D4FAF|nr:GNAT family N-acetyltransferase [Ureibacillus chungkukjangi]
MSTTPNIAIIKNNKLLINDDILKTINDNAKVFNMDREDLTVLNNAFAEGMDIPLAMDNKREVYEIRNNNELAGAIILVPEDDPVVGSCIEVDIFVFKQYQTLGIGKKAIELLVNLGLNKTLIANIYHKNKAKGGLISILELANFKYLDSDDELVTYYYKVGNDTLQTQIQFKK